MGMWFNKWDASYAAWQYIVIRCIYLFSIVMLFLWGPCNPFIWRNLHNSFNIHSNCNSWPLDLIAWEYFMRAWYIKLRLCIIDNVNTLNCMCGNQYWWFGQSCAVSGLVWTDKPMTLFSPRYFILLLRRFISFRSGRSHCMKKLTSFVEAFLCAVDLGFKLFFDI